MSFHRDFETDLAAVPDAGHVASGHSTITGTGVITTGLSGAIRSVVATVQAPSPTALSGFVAGAVAGTNAGDINVSVFDKAGAAATAPAVVHWFASDAQ